MRKKYLKEYMGRIHNELYEQLIDIDRVCRLNGIEYSLIAGTLLGAIRYNDFIPWDDDVDIVMTRENFIKFDSIYKEQKSEKFSYDYDGQWLKRLSLVNPIEYKGVLLNRICTDIFIFDNTPNNIITLKFKIFILMVLQGMIKDKPDYKSYNLPGKIASFITNTIGKLIPTNIKIKLYETVSRIGNKENTDNIWYYNAAFSYLNHSVDRNIISSYLDIPFRDHSFRIFKGYKEYLEVSYGKNYMIPPPVKDQVPQHIPALKHNETI